ncbi:MULTISPECIES: dicarboxylate/amino acid:cation symporter [unclassified Sphingomonas]|uniref:dicarboxylate/amino acid:cation symporter n=1 Tax=unclassified Sphingomonas TaxID=196159 RepID=UPI0006F81710|nr:MULTISPECIES: dicarboxylate/amino acid:cation symporter [unclassified Sphingomonas]KQX20781.1 sodium:proton antiporter [Sphingomonas sp. Root1294]KQY68627.1 sodium:proton antiporter [Sphingomonas sp. Root50]KRB88034.1 sodium:proton antiporter [Sphingomonas sp. Root720]
MSVAAKGSSRYLGSFGLQVLTGMAVGVLLGLAARTIGPVGGAPNGLAQTLDLVGAIFVQLLKTLVPPLIFAAIVSSIVNLRDLNNAARLVGQTLLWFAITALIAVTLGIGLGLLIQPGVGSGAIPAEAVTPKTIGSWLDFLKGLVPSNILGIAATSKTGDDGTVTTTLGFNALQIIVVSIAVGAAALRAGAAAEPFIGFVRGMLAIMRRLLWWVIRLTPIGSAGLIGTAIVKYGWDALAGLSAYAAAIYIGLAIILLLVYPALLLLNGISPRRFFTGAWPAIQLGFVSRSSVGTLPVTERSAEMLGVPRSYASFAVPLGSTTKMDGCAALYPAVSAIFVAQFYGLPLGLTDYGLIVFTSVLGSAATAGLTGATVMLTLTLSTLGLPLEGAGLLLAIDPILDMGRTAINVAGQILVPMIVAKREGILEEPVPEGVLAAEA